jgi:hypothetical protein
MRSSEDNNFNIDTDDNNVSDHEHGLIHRLHNLLASVDEKPVSVDIYDPANWSSLGNKTRLCCL